jgi:hypothetical protein
MAIIRGKRAYNSRKLSAVAAVEDRAASDYTWLMSGVSDDWGRFRRSARAIVGTAYESRPAVTEADVERWLRLYEEKGLLKTYEVDGAVYAEWTNYLGDQESQRAHHNCPEPPWSTHRHSKACKLWGTAKDREPAAGGTSKGTSTDKVEGYPPGPSGTTDPSGTTERTEPPPAGAGPLDRVFAHWQGVLDHKDAKLTPKRLKAIRARLYDGYTEDQLLRAIDGCKASAFHMGANDRERRYDDLTLICRDGEHVEQFIGYLRDNGERKPQPKHEPPGELSPDAETYVREVWAAFAARRGSGQPPGTMDDFIARKWHAEGVPLRTVLRGIADCSGIEKLVGVQRERLHLGYVRPAVEDAIRFRGKAVGS